MDLIEQAVFTSAETSRASGYQVVATSPGVCEADARELATWGPSHDALLESGPHAVSLNFHSLPSGAFCISRTTPSGFEYSGRGGVRVYTQCLVVPAAVLVRFANNPFALRAATANGSLRQYDKVPAHLEPIRLAGRTPAVDSALLARLCTNPGPEWMAALVQAATESVALAFVGGPPAEHLIAGLINCLPVECRADFSFSTGLKFSSRRPFRLVALAADPEEQRRIERLYNVAVLRINGEIPAAFAPVESWPRFIHRVLKSGRTSFLAARLARRHLGFSAQDLPLFGLQLLEELDATALEAEASEKAPSPEEVLAEDRPDLAENTKPQEDADPSPTGTSFVPAPASRRPDQHKAHAPHPQFQKGIGPAAAPKRPADSPSKHLDPDNPNVLEKLERLDDVVFEAISGNAEAAEQLKTLWPEVHRALGERLLVESREQYLRYALSIWNELQNADGTRNPTRAAHSLDVLCILFDQV